LAIVCRPIRAESVSAKSVSFVREVAPILVEKCQACHGPKTAESNYRVDTFDSLMRPGDFSLPPITAEDLDNSEIYRLITADDPEERMPNNGSRLTDLEIQAIADWIRLGAKFDGQDTAAPLRTQIPPDRPYPAAPATYPTAVPITAMTFTADGNQLIVGGYHELLIWDTKAGTLLKRVGNIPERTFGIAFNAQPSTLNPWLAVAGGSPGVSGGLRLIPWNDGPKKDAEPKVLAKLEDVVFDVAFRPDGAQLAAVAADGSLRIFDVATRVERLKINNHADWVTDVCYSADGQRIATGSRDKTAKVFDAESGNLLATHSEHGAPVRAVAFSPDDKTVISAGGNRMRVWNVEDSKLVGELPGFDNDIYALVTRGESVIATSADRTARQFKLADRTLVRTFNPHPAWVLSVAWHEPSHLISTGCFDATVTVWNLENGEMVKQFAAIPSSVAPTK
jgi:hypothetical protein